MGKIVELKWWTAPNGKRIPYTFEPAENTTGTPPEERRGTPGTSGK